MAAASLYFSVSLLFLLCGLSAAKEYLVGGSINSWTVSSSSLRVLNHWAEANRFQVGDSLVWRFDGKASVLEVTREAYLACNTSSPIAEHGGGAITVRLRRSGPHYFISGRRGPAGRG
ncbi:unnamed protein product [Spirodela intermedia]|uniref:Phytocyanin domain-containing protein n=1 Tax=Spirodela intermedia TaxID=51605 RepID=A0A7I8JQ43_SPIIN|nr:unnamed protein product [Spirodela intermedia]CAA6672250.1 unnamed protein product [Spirodela intermedia]